MVLDEETGLPPLPDGYYFRVEQDRERPGRGFVAIMKRQMPDWYDKLLASRNCRMTPWSIRFAAMRARAAWVAAERERLAEEVNRKWRQQRSKEKFDKYNGLAGDYPPKKLELD